jgi:hypothetical protein
MVVVIVVVMVDRREDGCWGAEVPAKEQRQERMFCIVGDANNVGYVESFQ